MVRSLNQIRNKLIDSAILALFIFLVPALLGSIIRVLQIGWQWIFVAHFISAIPVGLVYLFRSKLSIHFKTHFISILFIEFSYVGAIAFGISGAFYLCLLSVIVSTLIFGKHIGIVYFLVSLIGLICIAFLHSYKIIQTNIDFNIYNSNYTTWLNHCVAIIYVSLISIYVIGLFYELFLFNINELTHKTYEQEIVQNKLIKREEQLKEKNEEYLALNEELSEKNIEYLIAKEKAEESDRLKTAFLQNMSHEIRTPMNAIMGFSDLMIDNYNNKPKLQEFAGIISQRCADLLDIINDILDISKIESGQLGVNLEECNLNDLFEELTIFFTEYQNRIGKQHIKFSLQAMPIHPENIIITDKVKLKQIFINLINNAFKFTDIGTIEAGCGIDTDNNLLFYVSDTGIGIPPDKQQIIFERFSQLNPGTNKLVSGTGLGLSIVKGLVSLLGGKISLQSEPNKGSIFSFSFPNKPYESK